MTKRLIVVALLGLMLQGCALVSGVVNPCHKGTPQATTDCGS